MKRRIQIPIFKFRTRIKSVVHSSNRNLKIMTDIHELRRKNPDLVQVLTLLKKFEEFLFLRNKKSYTSKKEEEFLPFYHFFVYTKPIRTKFRAHLTCFFIYLLFYHLFFYFSKINYKQIKQK